MRAVVCRELTGLDGLHLEDLPDPEPGAGEVRVRVSAAGLNFADTLIIAGRYQEKPDLPFVPGLEIAGVVERVGPGVEGLQPGQRVMAALRHGGFAGFVVVRPADLVAVPDEVDDVAAAGFAIAYGTAHGALTWAGRLQSGETLLVHGAAGGVGLAAVEVGRILGAHVIATARGPEKAAVALAQGAHEVVDTASEDVRSRVLELTSGRGADVVFDPVGGDVFEASLRAIAWSGRLLIVGFASGTIPQIPANRLLVKNAHALGFYWGTYREHDPARVRASFELLLRWLRDGRIHPHVSAVLPLTRVREGLRQLLERRSTGKVVLKL